MRRLMSIQQCTRHPLKIPSISQKGARAQILIEACGQGERTVILVSRFLPDA